MILPGPGNNIRQAFDQLCDVHQVYPVITAEVDDMAMMRLLTRDTGHFAVLPPVVVRDELTNGKLKNYGALPGVFEEFYAIRIRRQFESPMIRQLIDQQPEDLLTFAGS